MLSTHSATLPQQMYNEPEARFFEFNYGPEYVLESIKAPIYLLTGAWCAALPACLGARLLCKCACAHTARLGKACCNAYLAALFRGQPCTKQQDAARLLQLSAAAC